MREKKKGKNACVGICLLKKKKEIWCAHTHVNFEMKNLYEKFFKAAKALKKSKLSGTRLA